MTFDILAISARNRELSLREPQPAIVWLPCWEPRVRAMALPSIGLAAVVTLVLLARARFRVKAADAVLLLVMGGLSAWMVRFGFFAAVVLLPVWARLIERALPAEVFAEPAEKEGASPALVGAVALVMLMFAAAVPVLARPQVFDRDSIPEEGLSQLRRALPEGRIYNFQPYGGPLTFARRERWRVLMDGRIYVYSNQEWDDYYDAAAGKVPVEQLVERHRPDAFFLHPFVQRGLIERLQKHPGWHCLYDDQREALEQGRSPTCTIFIPGEPETGIARASHE
jgi:hypothetical protein